TFAPRNRRSWPSRSAPSAGGSRCVSTSRRRRGRTDESGARNSRGRRVGASRPGRSGGGAQPVGREPRASGGVLPLFPGAANDHGAGLSARPRADGARRRQRLLPVAPARAGAAALLAERFFGGGG